MSKLKNNILNRKIAKFIKLIEENFNKTKRMTIVITPKMQGWPTLTKEVCTNLSAPNGDWIAVPLIIKTDKKDLIEFVLVSRNTIDCWDKWCSIIETQWEYFKSNKLNEYQLWVLEHMLRVSEAMRLELMKLAKAELEPKPQLHTIEMLLKAYRRVKIK